MRYDEEREVYRDCPWCHGKGCNQCKIEADKAYRTAFPNGPQPIATFRLDDPGDLERAKKAIGREALEHAFGPEGRGIAEIIDNLQDS